MSHICWILCLFFFLFSSCLSSHFPFVSYLILSTYLWLSLTLSPCQRSLCHLFKTLQWCRSTVPVRIIQKLFDTISSNVYCIILLCLFKKSHFKWNLITVNIIVRFMKISEIYIIFHLNFHDRFQFIFFPFYPVNFLFVFTSIR